MCLFQESNTPDLMLSDVIGTSVFNPLRTAALLSSRDLFCNIVLIDEINRSLQKNRLRF